MKFNLEDKPALLLVDIQKGFDDIEYWGGGRNNLNAEENAGKLLYLWREKELPIFHIKHCSTTPQSRLEEGQPGNDFKEIAQPMNEEPIIKKSVNSAFIGTDLKERLDKLKVKKLVIVGLTTDHCISTTTRMAGNFGFDTYIVHDATATFDKIGFNGEKYPAKLIHDTALASLHGEFATVIGMSDF